MVESAPWLRTSYHAASAHLEAVEQPGLGVFQDELAYGIKFARENHAL
jgi:hypothetical protein